MNTSPLTGEEARDYADFYLREKGKMVAVREAELLAARLPEDATVLSVGCGPARVEEELLRLRPHCTIMGVDVSREMLALAPPSVATVQAEAEHLPFASGVFDAVVYIASLEFMGNPSAAVAESHRVLRPQGRLVVLMLNPRSAYFRQGYRRPGSYIRRHIRHTDVASIEDAVFRRFAPVSTEYHLEITPAGIRECSSPERASLYLLEGQRE
ncbi:MAG: class I SAM-dependent methyltransferase [Thermoplasmatota archaeon]